MSVRRDEMVSLLVKRRVCAGYLLPGQISSDPIERVI